MSLSNLTNVVTAVGNGVTTVWPFAFNIPAAADLQVSVYDSVALTNTIIPSNQYSVTGLGLDVGGAVTYPLVGSPIPATQSLIIRRVMPLTQGLTLTNETPFLPATLMAALDQITMMIQQLDTNVSMGTLTIPVGSGYTIASLTAQVAAAAASATAAAAQVGLAAAQVTLATAQAAAAAASAVAAAASAGAVTAGVMTYLNDTGTADALVITPNPVIGAYADTVGFSIRKGAAANATTTPTINVNGKGAKTIQKYVAGVLTALAAGDMQANTEYLLMYSSGTGVMVLVNPNSAAFSLGTTIDGLTAKTTPVDADEEGYADSAASFLGKKLTKLQNWTNYLKPKADALYAALLGATMTGVLVANVGLSLATGATTPAKGQIAFPATQNASSDANTLDDYEEGTFTPTYTSTGSSFVYGSQTGLYTKVGNLVWFLANVLLAAGSTFGANEAALAGLPFALNVSITSMGSIEGHWQNLNTAMVQIQLFMTGGSTGGAVKCATAANISMSGTTTATTLFTTTSQIRFSGSYITT